METKMKKRIRYGRGRRVEAGSMVARPEPCRESATPQMKVRRPTRDDIEVGHWTGPASAEEIIAAIRARR